MKTSWVILICGIVVWLFSLGVYLFTANWISLGFSLVAAIVILVVAVIHSDQISGR